MFYAHFVLAKKGPLARIWLAAHWDKKLTKAHVFETNIESSVEGILQPKVKMALRTSGHLLLGIVRIYSRKAKYLLADCNEAFIKIKMAFRPGVVDLPEGNREAAVATITLPEVFHDFDSAMPDITIDMDAQVTLNQSRAEDITLKEDYGTLSLMADDGFGDMGFDDPEDVRDATNIDEGFDHTSLLLCDERLKEKPDDTLQGASSSAVNKSASLDAPPQHDGFGGAVGEGLLDGEGGGLFEPSGLFDDAPLDHVTLVNNEPEQDENQQPEDKPVEQQEDSDDDMYDMGPASMGAPSPPSSPESPAAQRLEEETCPANTDIIPDEANVMLDAGLNDAASVSAAIDAAAAAAAPEPSVLPPEMPPPPPPPLPPLEQPALMHNEEESFALAPLDATIVQGAERTVKAKRKRKLIVDDVKNISGEEMKSQLSDTTDIVTTLDLAPPTKRLMHWKETGGVEKLFALPGHPILSKTLSRMYQRHLTTRSVDNDEFGMEEDHIELEPELEHPREEPEVIARKRRREAEPLMPQDLSHFDPLQLDTSHPSYHNDPGLSHQALDVSPGFLQPHHMYPPMPEPQPQMVPPVLAHPPPAHMMSQMLAPEVNPLSYMSAPMHPAMMTVDQGPQLHTLTQNHVLTQNHTLTQNHALSQNHTITQNLHEVPPPVSENFSQVVHPVIDSVPQHLVPDTLPILQPPTEKQITHPLLEEQTNQQPLQEQLNQSVVEHLTHVEQETVPVSVNGPSSELHMNGPCDIQQTCTDEHIQQTCIDVNVPSLNVNMPSLPCLDDENDRFEAADGQDQAPQNILEMTNDLENHEPDINHIGDQDVNEKDKVEEDKVDAVQSEKAQESLCQQSDDEDDYGAPSSVGPALPEEQMADETYEQFEERILTKRTTQMLHVIHHRIMHDKQVNFRDVTKNCKRKQVAQKFYTFLVLKKQHAVELQQDEPYGSLIITTGPKYNDVYNAN